jgi:serine beta-lactamase-like protein LACTB, mitochondrial
MILMKTTSCIALLLLAYLFTACDKLDQIDIPNSLINLKETVNPQVDSVLRDEMSRQNLPGLAVGIYENDLLVHLKTYGYADWDNRTEWTLSTPCHWASISKSLTAVAAFKLIEDGHMSLNERVADSLPDWPQTGWHRNITIGHLLSNTSGIPHYDNSNHNYNAYTDSRTNFFNERQAVQLVDTSLANSPGSAYLYSTHGWNLAGAYIAAKARTAYGASHDYVSFLLEEVAKPMSLTSLAPTDNLTSRVRSFRRNCNYETIADPIPNVTNILPGGGWSSTIGDLMLFGKAMMEEEFLSSTTMETMWTIQMSNYAYGWRRSGSGSDRLIYHSGSKNGFKTLLAYFPDRDITVAIMTSAIDNGGDLFRFFDIIYGVRGYSGPRWNNPVYTMSEDIGCDSVTACLSQSTIDLSGVWRAGTATDQVIRRGLSLHQMADVRLWLRDAGFEITDIEVYERGGNVYYDGVFTRQTEQTIMYRNFQDNEFATKYNEEIQKGNRLVDIEVSVRNGTRYWSGLFNAGSGGWAIHRFISDNALTDSLQSKAAKGFRMIDLEPYYDGNNLMWATLWTKDNSHHQVITDKTVGEFNTEWNDFFNMGYSLIDLERYQTPSGTRYAGVFYNNQIPGALYRNQDVCDFINHFETLQANGRQLIDLEVHP